MAERSSIQFGDELLNCIIDRRNVEAMAMLNRDLARACDYKAATLLHYAAYRGNDVIVRALIELGAEVDCQEQEGRTPLNLAVQEKHKAAIEVLLEANANIDIVDNEGTSALSMALELDTSDFGFWIIEVFARRWQTETPTIEELAKRFIAAGCNMHHAAALRDLELMKCMLDRGIDVNSRGSDDRTALHTAIEWGDLNLTKWLIANGADVNSLDEAGHSALLLSTKHGNYRAMKILLEHEANPNCAACVHGCTPLLSIFSKQQQGDYEFIDCIELLFQYGVFPDHSSVDDRSLFDYALERSSAKKIEMLISYLAMLETFGESINKSIIHCNIEKHQSRVTDLQNYCDQRLRVLKITVFQQLSLFDLLNLDERRMKQLVLKEAFVSQVEEVCSKHKLNESSYFYKLLTNRIAKVSSAVKLENEAIAIICKISKGDRNLCYYSAREIISYLGARDRKQLTRAF